MAVAPPDGGDRPVGLDSIRAGIQGDDLVFILDIVIDHPLPSATAYSGRRPLDCGYNALSGWVYHSSVIAFPVHREDVF